MALTEYKIKVVDASNKPLLNFPMATRYVGGDKKNNKLTSDTDGVLTFQSDGRAVEVFVLAPIDKNGQPDMTKFKEDNDNDNAYYRITTLNVSRMLPNSIKSPYFLTDYGIAKTKFIFYENAQNKKIYSVPLLVKVSYLVGEAKTAPRFIETIRDVKNGELNITSILHSRIQIHPFKPDNTPFKTPQGYTPRSTTPVELPVYFDIISTSGTTQPNEPILPVTVPIVDDLIVVSNFVAAFKEDCINFLMADSTKCPAYIFNAQSEANLKEVCLNINKFYRKNTDYHPNVYEIAYMLSTGFIESYHYLKPVQLFSRVPEAGQKNYFNKYDIDHNPTKAKELGNLKSGDGFLFRGRGLVQLTGRSNYKKFTPLLNVDFEKNPDLACDFSYSVPIMIIGMKKGMFTNKKINDYLNTGSIDYIKCRRVINGNDRSRIFDSNAKRIEKLLKRTSPRIPVTF